MDSDPSEPGVSVETTNRRKSIDMSGPLTVMPDGTTSNAKVPNACLPAGERPNQTPIFISGFSDTRSFLAWLRASCPGGLMAQLKGEKLTVVPSTADGFRATVSGQIILQAQPCFAMKLTLCQRPDVPVAHPTEVSL